MYSRVAQRLTVRTAIALTICIALLPIPSVSLLISGAAQGRSAERMGRPKAGKPEGVWPDHERVRREKLDVKRALGLDFPTTQRYGTGDAYDVALSEYYNRTLAYACRKVKL